MHYPSPPGPRLWVLILLCLLPGILQAQADSAKLKAFFTPSELAALRGDSAGYVTVSSTTNSSQAEASRPEPVEFSAQYISDFSRNFSGGGQTGHGQMGLIDLAARFSTDSAGWFKGGEFMLHAEHSHGAAVTGDYVGDVQVFSNIESTPATYLYQLWYQQTFGNVSLLAGKHDLNSVFMVTDYGLLYVNSAFGVMSSGSLNVPLAIYPRTSLALLVSADFNARWGFRAAVYDGDPESFDTDPYGLSMRMSKEEGALGIGELHYHFVSGDEVTGTWKLGGYYHTADFERYTDTGAYTAAGNWGLYLHFDQQLFHFDGDEGKGPGIFGQIAYAPTQSNMTDFYVGFGFNYRGVWHGRNDQLGIAYAHSRISNAWRSMPGAPADTFESVIEITWKEPLGEHFFVQPDFQYIINPGLNPANKNACVGTVRCIVSF
ncbi:MAG: carbohydrate porin [Bacteroidia bacterium]|jgi:porin|nr:carbohydrate porin [Bacteroidia bacterium]